MLCTIRAIALTADAGEINYQQSMAAGFQRHIAKPIELKLLIQAIADVISSASAIVLEMMMRHRQEYLNSTSQNY
ncbi:putative two component hybrid sensor regulator [Calothrix sp. NIES-2100]|uniref:response regulator n=1 Tax=Calothrix sp. NIES-2100 TaxID=1954172 RepID=UPI000B622B6F|nr:putative two component hybrid sensor regulator [Calothrix sp. NIES-2100]